MNLFLYILCACFWGCSFLAIKVVLEVFPPFYSAFLRTFISFIFLCIYVWLWKKPSPLKDTKIVLKWAFLSLFAFTIPWATLFWGQQYVQPAIAGMINSAVPIFALCLSVMMLPDEKMSRIGMLGVFVGFIGMGCVFIPTIELGVVENTTFWGMVAIMVMSIAYATNAVFVRKVGRSIDIAWALIIQTFCSSVCLLTISGFMGESWLSISEMLHHTKASWGMLYLAFCSTFLAMLFFYHLIGQWGAVRTATLNYLLPFIAILVDFFVLGLLPSRFEWLGLILIVVGLLMLRIKPKSA